MIATNQSAVGRGIIQLADLFGIHAKLLTCVRQFGADIDGIFSALTGPVRNVPAENLSQECLRKSRKDLV